jgi:signal transduction histidine kinase
MPDHEPGQAATRTNRWGSVQVRTTFVATAAVALILALAVAALSSAVEHALTDNVRVQGATAVNAVVNRLEAGETPAEVLETTNASEAGTQTYVAILDTNGDPVTGAVLELPGAREDGVSLRFEVGTGDVEVVSIGSNHAITQRSIDVEGRTLLVVAVSPLGEVVDSVDAIIRAALVGVPLLIGAVAFITWRATKKMLRPIETIRTEVEALSTTTLDRRLPEPTTGDEVARLAATMNGLLDRLEMAALRQREFVSDASHELRSPVASIRAELEVSLAHPQDKAWPETAKDVLTETARLEQLIDDLLLLARTDEGTQPPTTPVDITSIVIEVAATAGRTHGVTIGTRIDDKLHVRGSPQGLTSVIRNLIDNAARHAATTVTITATRRAGRVAITVDDDGPGIPPADRERVFQRFARLDNPRSRNNGGVGLGLAVVDRVVHQHHGTTTVNEAPSGGARFEVLLPSAD